jgi:hypothetical protein
MLRQIAHDALAMIDYRDDQRAVLILADGEEAARRGRRAVEAAGCRVSDVAEACGGADRLDRQVAMDAVWVELEDDHGADLDRLLERLEHGAREQRFGCVVAFPAGMIDLVTARTPHPSVLQLCEASDQERAAAIALASAPRKAILQDVGREEGLEKLQQLSQEVGRIATMLATISEEAVAGTAAAAAGGAGGCLEISAAKVRAMIRARRLRDQFFASDFFADPAWDMLLDLMAARIEQQRVAVSSLCIAAAVPPTTALRWIKTLSDRGLFVRRADPQDGRRVYIELSDGAAAGMEAYLRAVERVAPLAV